MKSPGPNSCRKNSITLPNKNRSEPSLCGMPAQTRDRRRCLCTHRKMKGMLLRCAEEGHLGSRLIGEENQKGTRMPTSAKACRRRATRENGNVGYFAAGAGGWLAKYWVRLALSCCRPAFTFLSIARTMEGTVLSGTGSSWV